MQTVSDIQVVLLDYLSDDQMERVLPMLEELVKASKQQVKDEAIHLVKGFFPDPHKPGHECSDCLIVESVAETLEVYLPVKVYDEDA